METIKTFFAKFTNLFGSLTAISAAITLWLGQNGCLSTGDFAATCTIDWLPVSWMPYVTGLFIALTLLGKLTRPGTMTTSLFGSTAVVVPESKIEPGKGVGVVTPEQVKEP